VARKNGKTRTIFHQPPAVGRRDKGRDQGYLGVNRRVAGPPIRISQAMSTPATQHVDGPAPSESAIITALGPRSLVLVGMMGAGKSSIGRRLAARLGIGFVDADLEIEKAAGMTIPDIFASRGEQEFRAGEARVILRLLESAPQVLATGGGAFMNADTRAAIAAKGISIWLKAEFDVLMKRIKRRQDRPLLKTDDPGATLQQLIDVRYPVYALSDLTVQSREVPHDRIVDEIVSALAERFGADCMGAAAGGACGS
jgi:shikimate kinase